MAFCKLSSDFILDGYTYIENVFIHEYLPKADGEYVKTYIYGLFLSKNAVSENNIDDVCQALNLTLDQLYNIYMYWQDEGLVQITSTEPFEVKYLSFKNKLPKKYKEGKFDDFNSLLQASFPNRMITPNEYNEYYETMENNRIKPDAMIMIVQHCLKLRGENVNYRYILTVATNWANEGVRTVPGVEKKLSEYNSLTSSIIKVKDALNYKGIVGLYENQLFTKWTNTWGYSVDSIIYTAELSKKHTFDALDKKLEDLYRLNLLTVEEIANYNKTRKELIDIAVNINKKLGIYYEDLDNIIETYTVQWLNKGFSAETLENIANYCFLCSIKDLGQMNRIINKFYKLGYTTTTAVNDYINEHIANDNIIQNIIDATGTNRAVTESDRLFYKTWKTDWNISDELLNYATTLANGRTSAIAYLNQVLANWHRQNITTVEDAMKTNNYSTAKTPKQELNERAYTPQELNAVFSDIGDDNFDF